SRSGSLRARSTDWSARTAPGRRRRCGACFSMVIAALVRTRERFMGIGQLVMMPLFFASSALYPLRIMPLWLRDVARVNPLTYEVHGMRQLLVGVSTSGTLWIDFAVGIGFFALMASLAARVYPRAIL